MNRLFRTFAVILALGFVHGAQADEKDKADRADSQRVSSYLMKKFGVAKDKAEQIAKAVNEASEKYALPPALLLAIISIESRFKEKAKGTNGATGLMQVVPAAHRNLLKNVKDLTQPDTNIEVGSAILYGYRRSAGGDMNAALKSYGGSQAYASKVSKRVEAFEGIVGDEPSSDATQSVLPAAMSDAVQPGACDMRWTDFCIGPVVWQHAAVTTRGLPGAIGAANLPGGLMPVP
ncbi:lytic transglycosylase domain-containing protein [Paraburkholderia sp.]|uniref:lytic transglycosylase domain-containing protein n=1 Tax=Paraburkholderia sp. TaxID=1926495 RepID=UPI003D6F00B4